MQKPHRRSRATIAGLTCAVLAIVALSGCAPAAQDEPPQTDGSTVTLKIATIGILTDGAMQLGVEKGFFADEGLELETSTVANPPAAIAAAQGGQVDLAYAPTIPLLNALSQGIELIAVQAADGYPQGASEMDGEFGDTRLYASAASGIDSVEGLEGKTIAVPARKALLEVTITGALVDAGVDPASVKWIVLDFVSAVAALEKGDVDAAGLISPFTEQAAAAGATLVADVGVDFFEEGVVSAWVAGAAKVAENPEAMDAFQRAMSKANAYANEHPEEALQAAIDATRSTQTVEEATIPYWPTELNEADLTRVNKKLVDLGFLTTPVDLEGVILNAGG